MLKRRTLLKGAVGGLAGAILSHAGLARALAQSDGGIAAVPLREGLVQLTGAGGNVVVAEAPDGLVMVDSGAPQHAPALFEAVRVAFGERQVVTLFNTHWHLDHTGGNETAGADSIIAHENTRLWMSTEFYVRWQDRTYPPRPAAALPTDTFYSSDPQPIPLDLGRRTASYAHLPEAHTDGDIYVAFPEDNVIVAGDAVYVGQYPTLDYTTGGWMGGLVNATETLLELTDADTLIVPGKGPAVGREHLTAQLEMLRTVRERMETRMREGRSAAEMVDEGITGEFDAAWGEPDLFVRNAYHGLWWTGRTGGAF